MGRERFEGRGRSIYLGSKLKVNYAAFNFPQIFLLFSWQAAISSLCASRVFLTLSSSSFPRLIFLSASFQSSLLFSSGDVFHVAPSRPHPFSIRLLYRSGVIVVNSLLLLGCVDSAALTTACTAAVSSVSLFLSATQRRLLSRNRSWRSLSAAERPLPHSRISRSTSMRSFRLWLSSAARCSFFASISSVSAAAPNCWLLD